MKTMTLSLSDDLLREMEYAAAAEQTTVDDFVQAAIRKALPMRIIRHPISGLPTIAHVPGARPFTNDDIYRANDEDDEATCL